MLMAIITPTPLTITTVIPGYLPTPAVGAGNHLASRRKTHGASCYLSTKDSEMIDITLAKDIPHRTTITDNGVEYWTVTAITQHIGVAKSTFASYVARGQAPQPAFQLERTRLWDANEIKQWHASRPTTAVK